MSSKAIQIGSQKGLTQARSQARLIFGAVAFALVTALSAKIVIPLGFTPVPISLQSLSVILAGLVLGSKAGALSQVLLILLGLSGLPVFSSPLPGSIVLAGPTGGYIFGFILTAYFSGWIKESFKVRYWLRDFSLIFLGSFFIFLPGVIWLSQFTGQNLWLSIQLGVFPFLIGDVVKCAIASFCFAMMKKA